MLLERAWDGGGGWRTSSKRRTGFWPRILNSLQSSKTDKLTHTYGLNVPKLGETGPEGQRKGLQKTRLLTAWESRLHLPVINKNKL